MFYRYIERNMSGEGEIWNAFIKVPQNDYEAAKIDALRKLTRLSDNDEEEDSYYFYGNEEGSFVEYTEEQVNLLLAENSISTSNYMSAYMIGEIREEVVLLAAQTEEETPWYEVQEHLYKMQPIKEIK